MGDRGRRRWSEGAGVISAMYLARRFFNGTLSSAILRYAWMSNLFSAQKIYPHLPKFASGQGFEAPDGRSVHTGGEGVGCRSAAGALLGGCGLCAVLNTS